MLHVHPIKSLEHPALQPYLTMRWQQPQRDAGIFVAEGEKVVRRLLDSELDVVSLLLPEAWLETYRSQLDRRATQEIHVFVAPKEALEKLTGFSMYQGVLAVGRIPPAWLLREAIERSAPPRLFAAVDSLTNAENLGSLVRNCVAFGVQALLVGETCSSPWLRRAVRSSMGTIYQLPIVEPPSLAVSLRDLRLAGVRCVAAHPHTDRRTLAQADLRGDCCLVFGSEGKGIAPEVLAACDEAVLVPMSNSVDSLNVGAAAAVFLYEAARQRGRV
ncbi:MAG: RNA methyltransferase [Verrucomicrobia bacterium]|nr:RNA methyltransferase [Verrucomicrobiota bacterium]